MKTKNQVTRTVVVFAVLAIAGVGVAIGGRSMADVFDRSVMVAVGSATFGAALAFFLVRMFGLVEK